MLVQIHILQNYAPSNLNRDDSGSPKDAVFGGYQRGRISSQCIKRSIRRSTVFSETFEQDSLLGYRTKLLPGRIEKQLRDLGIDEATIQAIVKRVPEIGRESTKAREGDEGEGEAEAAGQVEGEARSLKTQQLIFIGENEERPLAEKLLAIYQEAGPKQWAKLKINEITKKLGGSIPRSVDIAMFGRMTTSDAFENVQAAVQVAHALSTNALTQEFDFFTAVDDISGESGAGMLGDVEFNSSTYYKYMNVHWEELQENLGKDAGVARRAVLALLEAAATAQPSGKQNSFAAFNLPDFILVEVSDKNLPVSYANAFLRPARASGDKTLVDASIIMLSDYMGRIRKNYKLDGKRAYTAVPDVNLPGVAAKDSLSELQEWLATQLPEA
ncbi:MAG: type I-E CRISPR-associated protein Cas7/Cse4/CasC [Chloroflexi bacterium]|nr:type I-E CRISPR-associated protein Cas7/Cse4/CasC [Chloroflexota bacterium]